MVVISEMAWAVVPMAACWALVVHGLTRAIFRSFVADEIKARLGMRYSERFHELAKRRWELKHGYHFDETLIQNGTIHEQGMPLGDDLPGVKRAFRAGMRQTLPARINNYLLSCRFCQACEVAAVVFMLTRPMSCWWPDLIPTVIMYGAVVAACAEAWGASRPGPRPGT